MMRRKGSLRFTALDLSPARQADLRVGHDGDDRGYHVGARGGQAEVEARERRVVRAAARQDVRLGKELEGAYRREDRAKQDDGPKERYGNPKKAGEATRAVYARGVMQFLGDVLEAGEYDDAVVPRP